MYSAEDFKILYGNGAVANFCFTPFGLWLPVFARQSQKKLTNQAFNYFETDQWGAYESDN